MAVERRAEQICVGRAAVDLAVERRAYDHTHADEYLRFVRDEIDGLATTHPYGVAIRTHPGLRYRIVRKHPSGHGHVAVYRVDGTAVTVVHVWHTAQDWRRKLPRQRRP